MMIEDLTDAVGRYVWLHRHLAESLRLWGADEEDGAVAVYLHRTARRLAEHGAGWEALLADSPALGAAERVRAPSPGWEELFRGAATGTSDRLVVLLAVVLPRMRASLERFAAQLGDVAEAAEGRLLRHRGRGSSGDRGSRTDVARRAGHGAEPATDGGHARSAPRPTCRADGPRG